jgi:hypothetical protein
MIREATLIKRRTENGLVELEDHVPLGKRYRALPAFRRTFQALHESGVYHEVEMVMTDDGQWFATELLSWPGKGEAR